MLKNIKSSYILRNICSLLNEGQKLRIAKYNKNLQHILEISLINYKFFSGKYIIYELNGNIKEYLGESNSLLYEGGYLNGKRNGKGKEYDKIGQLIFEGEYLNGKRNGKGKEYDEYGHLLYDGIFLNGERNGKGKDYFWKDKSEILEERRKGDNNILKEYLEFDVEYLNGKIWKGKIMDSDGDIHIINNDINGKVKEFNGDELIFEGEYLNGERSGKGKIYGFNGDIIIFEGEYLKGKKNGRGKEYNIFSKITFEGEYLNGKKNGKGKEFYKDGTLIFEGEYLNNKKWNGKGYNGPNKIIYELIQGNGKIKEYVNGTLLFEGEYLNGERNGKGKEYYKNGKLFFEGEYLNGERNEKGKE